VGGLSRLGSNPAYGCHFFAGALLSVSVFKGAEGAAYEAGAENGVEDAAGAGGGGLSRLGS
jgi:hypothetical protein